MLTSQLHAYAPAAFGGASDGTWLFDRLPWQDEVVFYRLCCASLM